jgi:hypothetical protein
MTFNNQTGGVNAVALDPTTGLPGVLYYDKSALAAAGTTVGALKYAYQDSLGVWHIEVVDANHGTVACGNAGSYCIGAPNAAGGSTASILQLAYRSDGRPVAAYVFGASRNGAGSKQVRFAERALDGSWSIEPAFASSTAASPTNVATATTVDPIKGLTLLLDANDRPHLFFTVYTQTITNSSHVYAFRNSLGVWTTSVVAPAVSGGGTVTALGQGVQQSGGAICPASTLPMWTTGLVDGPAGVTRPQFVACTSLSPSGACSAFHVRTLTNGCGISQSCFSSTITTATDGGQRTDLVIDANSQRPLVGIYTVSTPATSLLTVAAPQACAVAQPFGAGAWGAPVTLAGGSAGANGFRLAPSNATLNENFIAYLVGTTDVRLSRATGPSGAWLPTGALVETTTVGAEGVGFAVDPIFEFFHLSYAQLPAAAANAFGNDLRLAYGPTADIVNAGTAGTFPIDVVDNMTNAFAANSTPMLAAARSAAGLIGFAYFYEDLTPADSRLYYGVRGGTATAPVFGMIPVVGFAEGTTSPQFLGSYPSLAFDANDNPVIAFYDGRAAQQDLLVARSSDGGSTFATSIVDAIGNVGQYPSVATFGSTVAVAYYDVTNTALKFARFVPGSGWSRFTVDGGSGTGSCGNVAADAGRFAVLRVSSAGRPVVAYQSDTNLRIAMAAEPVSSNAFSWTCLTIDAGGATRGAGIAFVLAPGDEPRLVHFDATAGSERYVRCTGDVAACIAGGPGGFAASVVGVTGTTSLEVTRPSLLVFPDGREFVSYHSASLGALVLASRPNPSAAWTFETLDAAPAGSSFTALAGQYSVLLPNDSNGPLAIYRSYENWIRYFSREQ